MTLVEPLDHYLAPRTMQAVQATGKSPVVASAQREMFPTPDSVPGNSNFGGQYPVPTVPKPPQNPQATPSDNNNSGGGGSLDYGADPYLQQTLGMIGQQRDNALAGLTAQERQELLRFGDSALAMKRLRLGADDPFIRSISADPDTSFSTLAQLAKAYRDNTGRFNEGENNANLFYSGHRVKGLGELAYQNNRGVDTAAQAVQGNLSKIDQGRVNAQSAYDQARIAAEEGAYERAVALAQTIGPTDLSPVSADTKGLADLTNYWLKLGAPTTVSRPGGAIGKAPAGYGASLLKALKAPAQPKLRPVGIGFGGRRAEIA